MYKFKSIASLFICSLLTACGVVPVKEQPPEAAAAKLEESEQAPEPPRKIRQVLIDRLLSKANAALERGRLSLPVHDNAYDHFKAVLQFDPENPEALSGLDAVLLAYCDLARERMKTDPGTAALFLQQALELYPESSLLKDLERDLRQYQQPRMAKSQAVIEPGEKVELPISLLQVRDEGIKNLLADVTERVKQHNERVIIHARNDAEGRWIYQTMKSFAGEYRIRGDIRINPVPHLILLEALPL